MSPTTVLLVLIAVPLVPLLVAIALAANPASRLLQAVAPWTALAGLAAAGLMPDVPAVQVPWLLEGSELGLDATGRVFLFAAALVCLAAGVAARSLVTKRTGRFLAWFLVVMSGCLGVTLARDMLSFYLFFSMLSFAAYGLVVHERSQRARYAGRVYLTFVLFADMMIFAALVLIAQDSAGDLRFEVVRGVLPTATYAGPAILLLVLGFGVKVGVLGVHVTLPLIYAAAPVPAGVVLSGALLNAGLLGWLRLMPMGLGSMPGWGRGLMALGTAAVFYGAVAGVLQRRARTVLAYSSISQMGIMTMAVGVGLSVDHAGDAVLGAVTLYALHHALAKAALFLGTGVARCTARRHGWLIGLGLLLPALALSGAPLTSGMLAKEALKEALGTAPAGWHGTLQALLPWMAVATAVVLGRFLWLAWPRGRETGPGLRGGPLAAWLALLLATAAAAWLMPGRPHDLWRATVLWEVSWPVLLGALLCGAAIGLRRRGWLPAIPILPPGDVLVVLAATSNAAVRGWKLLGEGLLPALGRRVRHIVVRRVSRVRWAGAAATAERWLVDWPVALSLLVVMILMLWLLVIRG